MRRETCPPLLINNNPLPQQDSAQYLGINLDKRLTWKTCILKKRMQLGLKLRQMYYWLFGRKFQLWKENKLL